MPMHFPFSLRFRMIVVAIVAVAIGAETVQSRSCS
jgi:hypothetical protein